MTRTIACCLTLLVALSAEADTVFMNGRVDFADDTAPNVMRVELRTVSDQTVSWSYTFPTVNRLGSWMENINAYDSVEDIDPSNVGDAQHVTAAQLGLDWVAWNEAVMDPDFTRLLVTRGGTTLEAPWTHQQFSNTQTPFEELDQLRLRIGNNDVMHFGDLYVTLTAWDNPIVPEPATWLMLLVGVLHYVMRRQYKACPCGLASS